MWKRVYGARYNPVRKTVPVFLSKYNFAKKRHRVTAHVLFPLHNAKTVSRKREESSQKDVFFPTPRNTRSPSYHRRRKSIPERLQWDAREKLFRFGERPWSDETSQKERERQNKENHFIVATFASGLAKNLWRRKKENNPSFILCSTPRFLP